VADEILECIEKLLGDQISTSGTLGNVIYLFSSLTLKSEGFSLFLFISLLVAGINSIVNRFEHHSN
jgi:hypothetical protein